MLPQKQFNQAQTQKEKTINQNRNEDDQAKLDKNSFHEDGQREEKWLSAQDGGQKLGEKLCFFFINRLTLDGHYYWTRELKAGRAETKATAGGMGIIIWYHFVGEIAEGSPANVYSAKSRYYFKAIISEANKEWPTGDRRKGSSSDLKNHLQCLCYLIR